MCAARLSAGVAPQPMAAFLAAATAASTSSTVESGRLAVCSPVAGLYTGAERRDAEVILFPSMAFWMVCMAAYPAFSIRRLEDACEDINELLIDLLLLDGVHGGVSSLLNSPT